MANEPCSALLILLLNLVPLLVLSADTISRSEFPLPPDFVFGSGTSAYQSEAKKFTEGRTPSIWDTFAHSEIDCYEDPIQSGNVHGATGDVGYHKYKEDVQLGGNRLTDSPSPDGRGHVNPKGVEYYNHFINELIKHGIQAHVTLMHIDFPPSTCYIDFPQILEDEYGWLSRQFVKDFTAYADVCFREFGGTVLHWTTLNEANVFSSIYRKWL